MNLVLPKLPLLSKFVSRLKFPAKLRTKKKLIPIAGLILITILVAGGFILIYRKNAKPAPIIPTIADDAVQSQQPQHIATSSSSTVFRVPILMYHYIEHVKDPGDTIRQKLNIYPETLGLEIKTLQDDGYTFLYASEVAQAIDGKMKLPAKPIVLTFDDGYKDFYTDALPVLQKYHVKATAYIITGFLGRPNYMTVDQLKAVKASGIVEIGAHTENHIDLNHATVKKQTEEIVNSKKYLEKLFSQPVTSFAYPSGRFNQDTVKIVQAAGFTNAVSTNPGTQVTNTNRFVLFRLRPGSRSGKVLLSFLDKMMR